MSLYKIKSHEGESENVVAKDYFELNGYTIFVTGNLKDVAIKTSRIEEITDITGNSGQFPPQQIYP